MPEADLASENARLRELLEEHRQRELDDLRSRLAEAVQSSDHYRAEAQRNADLGREIAAGYQQQVSDLKLKLQTLEQVQPNARNR